MYKRQDVNGAVLVNAINGESQYYEDVPTWVDRLYSSDIIMEQYDYYGQYHNGFLNAYFGQRDVTLTTDGWNYIAINDDVYMYTGVTSVTSDQSNIGFILTNQRTKETRFYPCAGATEASAKSSAQSQVQQMRYSATFPLLLNIADQPTYFMALKGEDGLVKMYAMVNVQQYNIVETGQTVAQCEENYRKTLLNNGIIDSTDAEVPAEEQELWEKKGTIAEIRSAVIEGTSVYYLRFEGESAFSVYVSAAQVPEAPLLNVGDSITVYWKSGTQWITAQKIEVENRAVSTPPEEPAAEEETDLGDSPVADADTSTVRNASDDPMESLAGGELGWTDPNEYVFYNAGN